MSCRAAGELEEGGQPGHQPAGSGPGSQCGSLQGSRSRLRCGTAPAGRSLSGDPGNSAEPSGGSPHDHHALPAGLRQQAEAGAQPDTGENPSTSAILWTVVESSQGSLSMRLPFHVNKLKRAPGLTQVKPPPHLQSCGPLGRSYQGSLQVQLSSYVNKLKRPPSPAQLATPPRLLDLCAGPFGFLNAIAIQNSTS